MSGTSADGNTVHGFTNDEARAKRRASELGAEGCTQIRLWYNPASGSFEHEFSATAPTFRDFFTIAFNTQTHLTAQNAASTLGANLASVRALTQRLHDEQFFTIGDLGSDHETWRPARTAEEFFTAVARPHVGFKVDDALPLTQQP